MEGRPRISVAVPTYKRPEYLRQCLESIYSQTLLPDEIVISDDGGDPETKMVIDSFDHSKISVRHIVNRPSLKQYDNRVQAFRLTRGELVAMLDDDDRWLDSFLENTVNMLQENPDCSFCSSDHYIMNSDGHIMPEESDLASRRFGRMGLQAGRYEEVFLLEITRKCFPLQFTLFRRSDLDKIGFFPRKGGMVPDFALFLELGALRKKGIYIAKRLGAYRVHAGQQTVRQIENASSMVGFLDSFETNRLKENERQAFRRFYNKSLIELAVIYAHRKERKKSIQTLQKVIFSELSLENMRRLAVLSALFVGFSKKRA